MLLLWTAIVPASAGAPGVPADVAGWFGSRDALNSYNGDPSAPDAAATSATSIGSPVKVYSWSPSFLEGESGGSDVRPSGVWAAVALAGTKPVGVVTAWRNPDTDAVELATAYPHADAASGLADVAAGERVVWFARASAWYLLGHGRLRPLNAAARELVPHAMPVDTARDAIARHYRQVAHVVPSDDSSAGGGAATTQAAPNPPDASVPWLMAGAFVLVLAAGGGLWHHRRHRRIGA